MIVAYALTSKSLLMFYALTYFALQCKKKSYYKKYKKHC